jgi:glutathione synthase/RimK-type ligase-like ATP-grasp enzyme
LNYKVGFITYELLPELIESEREFAELVKGDGLIIEPVDWRDKSVDYSKYDLIIIRTCWDYFIRYEEFTAWLKFMQERNVNVLNSLKTVNENLHKFYLKDLQTKGIKILDTIFINKNSPLNLKEIFQNEEWNKAVVKPAVSGGGYKTHLISDENISEGQKILDDLLNETDVLLQKFAPEISTAGEWSLIFFNKKYSHAVLKLPKENDFRVQSQHGGTYHLKEAPEEIIIQASKIIDTVDDDLLYARVDGVVVDGEFSLMELELIEPDLFLLNREIMKRFEDAILKHLME